MPLPLLPLLTPDDDELEAVALGLAVAAEVAELSELVLADEVLVPEPAVLAVAVDDVFPP